MSDRLAALAAVVAVLGALVGERLGPSRGGWCLAAAVLSVAGARWAHASGRPRPQVSAWALLAVGLVASAGMQRALDGLDGPVAHLAAREPDVVATVTLTEDPKGGRWNARALARVVSISGACPGRGACRTGNGGLVAVMGEGQAARRLRVLEAGETAVLSGWLRPPAGPEARLRWRHAAAVLVADDLLAAAPPGSPVLRLANRLRRLVLSGAGRLPEVPGTLTAGLLVGDDRGLPAAVAADFRAAGLSHLLAVSGANVALVLAVAGPVLRRFGLAGRFAGGMAVVGVFAAVARFEPSVLRAAVMAGIALMAAYAGRPAQGRRMLALAVAGLVLVDPFLVHSLGFQLSVAASAGILVLARTLAARLPGPSLVREALAVTAAAQLAVAPVALPTFGSVPLVALPANLLAAPAAAALTLWGFGSGLAGGVLEPVVPGLPAALAVPTGALAAYLAGVADVAARVPLSAGPPAVAGLVAVSLLTWAGSRRLRPSPPELAPPPVPPRGDCPGPELPGP